MISERIKTLAALVPPAKSLADVGCDHGYLLVEAFQKYGYHSVTTPYEMAF